jgi:hypothetical protein
MFTVKIIDSEGNENVYQARSVSAKASERLTSDMPYAIESVWFQIDDNSEIELSGQGATIYVMNDNGKTVSKYTLGVNDGEVSIGVV